MGNYLLSIADHIIFFILGLLIPLMSVQQGKPEFGDHTFDTQSKIKLYYSNGLVLWVGVFFIFLTWHWNQRSFTTIGFSSPILNGMTILCTVILIGTYLIELFRETISPIRKQNAVKKWEENTPFLPSNHHEYKHFIFAAFSAAFCEEVIFRGFFINYMLAFTNLSDVGLVSAIVLPALLFGVMHIYQGHAAVIKIIIGGVLFGLIFYYSQSLWIAIIIHFVIDLIAGYLPIYFAEDFQADVDDSVVE